MAVRQINGDLYNVDYNFGNYFVVADSLEELIEYIWNKYKFPPDSVSVSVMRDNGDISTNPHKMRENKFNRISISSHPLYKKYYREYNRKMNETFEREYKNKM